LPRLTIWALKRWGAKKSISPVTVSEWRIFSGAPDEATHLAVGIRASAAATPGTAFSSRANTARSLALTLSSKSAGNGVPRSASMISITERMLMPVKRARQSASVTA